jgi:hypothetical protein
MRRWIVDEVERLRGAVVDAGVDAITEAASMRLSPAGVVSRVYAAMHAKDEEHLRDELRWIEQFADIRSKDDGKTFARVNRGALRTIAEHCRAALAKDRLSALPGSGK